MAYKVVYNACYGGFSLSRDAVLMAREMSGNPTWGGTCLRGDKYPSTEETCDEDYGFISDVPRHDPVLVSVVDSLGGRANGEMTKLRIREIAGNLYRIDEYDGYESVVEPHELSWFDASKP